MAILVGQLIEILQKYDRDREVTIHTLNRRNAEQVACTAIQEYAKLIQEGNCYQGYRIWDSSCGHTRARGYKPLWVVDSKNENYLNNVIDMINRCRGAEPNKVKYIIPTLHGYHLITIGFDCNQFAQELAIRPNRYTKGQPHVVILRFGRVRPSNGFCNRLLVINYKLINNE